MAKTIYPFLRAEVAHQTTRHAAVSVVNNVAQGYVLVHGKQRLLDRLLPGEYIGTMFFCSCWDGISPQSHAIDENDILYWSAKIQKQHSGSIHSSKQQLYANYSEWLMSLQNTVTTATAFGSKEALAHNLVGPQVLVDPTRIQVPQLSHTILTQSLWDQITPALVPSVQSPTPVKRKPRKKKGPIELDF